jgi:uncharacterized membrane protein
MKKEEYYIERGLDRIIALSDCVFAFSLTLLALDLVIPESLDAGYITDNLVSELPRFIYFFMTFFITAAYWGSHHRIFRFICSYDDMLMRLNMFLLVCIILMPFITKLISEHGNMQIVVIIAALGYAAPGLLLSFIWHYSSKGYLLIDKKIPADYIRVTTLTNYFSPIIFLLSIPLSFLNPSYSLYFWLLLIPKQFFVGFQRKAILNNN